MGEKRQVLFFGYIFAVFNGPTDPSRGLWEKGRLKEGVGGGLIDLKNLRSERSQISGPK